VLLDSSFLHDLVREDSAAVERLEGLIDERVDVAVSTLTVFEVGIGLRGDAERYHEPYYEALDTVERVPLGDREARTAVRIQHRLLDRGERIGAVDVLIAGTAVARDVPVLTRNADEFERVEELAVETY
jgi:predicted nucleic acid-binding protein